MFKSVHLTQVRFTRPANAACISRGPKFDARSIHHRNFSAASSSESLYSVGRKQNESLDVYRKKLLYRSKLRGMKETILLLGTFATKYLKSFDEGKMKQFEAILEEPDPDVYNWVVGTAPTPPQFENEVMLLLKQHVRANPLEGSLDEKVKTIS